MEWSAFYSWAREIKLWINAKRSLEKASIKIDTKKWNDQLFTLEPEKSSFESMHPKINLVNLVFALNEYKALDRLIKMQVVSSDASSLARRSRIVRVNNHQIGFISTHQKSGHPPLSSGINFPGWSVSLSSVFISYSPKKPNKKIVLG
jgi:hypothetical protein